MDNFYTSPPEPVDCLKCRHFRITWEAEHPRACQAMGFKTALWPWQEVLRSSGEPCLKFEPKGLVKKGGNQDKTGSTPPHLGRFSRVI